MLLVLAALLVAGCTERHNKSIDSAYQLLTTAPDSSLSILNGVKSSDLSKSERARFALFYTIAQDKSGLDVDNDSLLRNAYTYYNNKVGDSLYAKCEYYMGKYYMLNDSSEQALHCLKKSIDAAEKQGDKYTQCLALEKYSRVIRQTDPQKAVGLARLAEKEYSNLPDASQRNIIYYKLNVGVALLMVDSVAQAESKCKETLKLAYALKDSDVISDVYQDLALIAKERRDFRMALNYSKASCYTCTYFDIYKSLNLANAYLDAGFLTESIKLLSSIHTKNAKVKYFIFNTKHLASIKAHNYDKAYSYADSAYHYLEQMYGEQLESKINYYNALAKTKTEMGIAKEKIRLMAWLIAVSSISALIIIILILNSNKHHKARLKLEEEKLLKEKELHDLELRHKEIQLSTIRNFILKRIDTVQKIEKLKGNKIDSVQLSEEDWEEIRLFVDSVEDNFVTRLQQKFPDLNEDDIRLMMLIRLKMPAKALALIYGISEKSIKQKLFVYKNKVGIGGEKMSLRSYIEGF